MAKSKYVAAKIVAKAKFDSPDQQERLTITASEGKNKFNLKASIKKMGKDMPASTGCPASFKSVEDVQKAFDVLVKESKARGWKQIVHQRYSFTSIPAAPGSDVAKKDKKVA